MKKFLLTGLAAFSIILSGMGISSVYAQAQNETISPFTGLAESIAQKFNLNQSEVEAVVKDYQSKMHEEHKVEMQKRMEDKLNKAVSEGKISEDQKNAILSKLLELKGNFNRDKFADMTDDERKAAHEEMRNELKSWADQNNIDMSYLRFGNGQNGFKMRFKP